MINQCLSTLGKWAEESMGKSLRFITPESERIELGDSINSNLGAVKVDHDDREKLSKFKIYRVDSRPEE